MIAFLLLQNWSVNAQGPQCGRLEYSSHALAQGKLAIDVSFKDFVISSPTSADYASIDLNVVVASICGPGSSFQPFSIDAKATQASLNLNVGATPVLTINGGSINYSLVNLKGFKLPGSNPSKRLFSIYLIPTNPLEECCVVLDETTFPKRDLTNGNIIVSPIGGPMLYLANGAGGVIACPVTTPANPFEKFCNVPENALTISGKVTSPLGICPNSIAPKPIPNVTMKFERVNITGNIAECNNTTITTDANGDYMSCDVPANNNYNVRASKDCSDNPACGLSTLDISILSQGILGNITLSWWQKIAGEVDDDPTAQTTTLTNKDIIRLRNILLKKKFNDANGNGIQDPGEPNVNPNFNDCWVFIPKNSNYNYTTAASLVGTPYNVSLASTSLTNVGFVGIKKGDLNGSCYCNELAQRPSESTEELLLPDFAVSEGEVIDVPVLLSENSNPNVYGFDMKINPEDFEIIGIKYNEENRTINSDYFDIDGFRENHVKFLWTLDTENPIGFREREELFSVRLRAKRSVETLRESILLDDEFENITSKVNEDLYKNLSLNFREGASLRSLHSSESTYKNTASATVSTVGENTLISYSVPNRSNSTVNIYNLQGKNVFSQNVEAHAGTNSIEVSADLTNQTGMYFYTIVNPNGYFTGRFIKISK